MITFNIQSDINGNFFRGSKPDNNHQNYWSTHANDALVLTLEQVRKIRRAIGRGNIAIEPTDSPPLTTEEFDRELYCMESQNPTTAGTHIERATDEPEANRK